MTQFLYFQHKYPSILPLPIYRPKFFVAEKAVLKCRHHCTTEVDKFSDKNYDLWLHIWLGLLNSIEHFRKWHELHFYR